MHMMIITYPQTLTYSSGDGDGDDAWPTTTMWASEYGDQ